MSMRARLEDRITQTLAGHAARVAAPNQTEWVAAMVHELEHVPRGKSALSWALGCMFVSYSGRLHFMARSLVNLPRWLLLLEMLLCLGPVSAYFILVAVSTAQGYLLFVPAPGYTPVQEGLIFGSATLIGPVGLAVAFKTLFLPAPGPGKVLTGILCLLAIWTLAVFVGLLVHFQVGLGGPWLMLVPAVLLPAAAVAHLAWLGSLRRPTSGLAGK